MKTTHFSLKKFSIIFIMILSFIISSCSEDSSLGGDGNTQNNPKETTPKKDIITSVNGVLVDGYIKNATVCIDSNDDGSCLGDIRTKTNDKGEFSLTFTAKEGTSHTIIGTGGTDTATNKRFNGTYKNIIEVKDDKSRAIQSLNITPITTIVAHIYIVQITINPSYSVNSATDKVASSLGLSRNQVATDPLQSKAVFEKTQQVVQTIAILSSTMQSDETNANTKKSFDFVMIQLSVSINTGNHEGELDVEQVVSTLNESTYEGEEVAISDKTVSLAKDTVSNISEKVAASDGTDLTSIQVETQKSTDTITSNTVSDNVAAASGGGGGGGGDPTPEPRPEPVDTVKPVFTSSNEEIKVYAGKTSVTTVKATDDSAITYSVGGNDGSSFNVDASSGVITFKTAPNLDEQARYSLSVSATDAKGNKATQDLVVNILAADTTDPVFTSPSTKSVKENQTAVMDLKATDANPITYSIDASSADTFTLDSSSGKITFKNAPDYEKDPKSYSIAATVKDESENSATQTITIAITDVDEIDPDFGGFNGAIIVSENKIDVVTLKAEDDSDVNYSISGDNSDKFNLDSSSGEVTFKVAPDYETMGDKKSYSFTAQAEDTEGNKATTDVVVTIEDVDEANDKDAPEFKTESLTIDVNESQTDVMRIKAEDISAITYSIKKDKDSSFNVNSANGVVTFKVAPDYESDPPVHTYTFSAIATDANNNEANQSITVHIKDIDEVAPSFGALNVAKIINEGTTDVITLAATDDTTNANNIVYGISGGDSSSFNIDGKVITFKEAPDYETKDNYSFNATATDEAGNKATKPVTVKILYVDSEAPIFTSSNTANVDENDTEENKIAITLVATDKNKIIYSISGTDSDKFAVDGSSGVIKFKSPQDFESIPPKNTYEFRATATDEANNVANKTITINIIDINDEKPIFTSSATPDIDENKEGTIFSLEATDGDANTAIKYGIIGGSDKSGSAIVNPTTGAVSFTGELDFETDESIELNATASDGIHIITQEITLTINDVDDDIPEFSSLSEFNVAESSSDKKAFTVVATDKTTPITYGMNGADSDSFEIDSSGGIVTFKDFPDYETKTSYSFIVTAKDPLKNQASQTITLSIEDANDEKPIFETVSNNYEHTTKENEAYSFTVKATDKDTKSENNTIKYSLKDIKAQTSEVSIDESSGDVTLTDKIDYETSTDINFTVVATDGENETDQNVSIILIDVDENPPKFTTPEKVSVKENQGNVIQLGAEDESAITYSISGDDSDSFYIHKVDGWLSFKVSPDYETKKEYKLETNATDVLGNTAKQDLIITILNVDEEAPVFTSEANVSVDENQKTAITLKATDTSSPSDAGSGDDDDTESDTETRSVHDSSDDDSSDDDSSGSESTTLTYSINGGDSSNFDVDDSTGIVTFTNNPDYETKRLYIFDANATDEAGNFDTQSVKISINNINEHTPVFTSRGNQFSFVKEKNAMTLVAQDADDNNITYEISGDDSSKFDLNETTGEIKFITTPQMPVMYNIAATASDGEKTSATQSIQISVQDSMSTLVCDENQTYIKFYPDAKEGRGRFEHLWKEGTSSVKDTNVIHFNKIKDIKSYALEVTIGSDPKSIIDINTTISITSIKFIDDDSAVSPKIHLEANGAAYLKSKDFEINTQVIIKLIAKNEIDPSNSNSNSKIDETAEITTTIGIEDKPSKAPIGLHFKSVTADSVKLGWCKTKAPSYKISRYDSSDSGFKIADTNDPNGTVTGLDSNILHSFAVAGATGGGVGIYSDTIDITTKDSNSKVNFKISKVTFNQAVQVDMNDDINSRTPLIAGKPGILRVFVDMENSDLPNQKVEIKLTGTSADDKELPSITKEVVLENSKLFSTNDSTNKPVVFLLDSERWLESGNKFSIKVNSNGKIEESNDDDNVYPSSDENKSFGFKNRNGMLVHILPVNTQYGNVVISQNLLNGAKNYLQHIYPLNNVTIILEDPMYFKLDTTGETNGAELLTNIYQKKEGNVTNNKTPRWSFYTGVFKAGNEIPYNGLATVVNIDSSITSNLQTTSIVKSPAEISDYEAFYQELARQIGHNHGLSNTVSTKCDEDETIGKTGYSQYSKLLYNKETNYDIMTNCISLWISDNTYKAIYNFETALDSNYGRTIVSRSISSHETLIEGRLISGTLTNNKWKIIGNSLFKREDTDYNSEGDFLLKVELINGDIFEMPISLVDLSSIDVKMFNVFIPSTKDVKAIQVVNKHNDDIIKVDF